MLKLLVGLIVGIVAAIAVMNGSDLLSGEVFVFEEDLEPGELSAQEQGDRGMEYTVPFQNDDGDTVARATIETVPLQENLSRLRVNVTQEGDTVLDSLRLQFETGQDASNLAFQTPGGSPWPSVEYQATDEPQGAEFEVSDLGDQGDGSVTLDFLIGPDAPPDQVTIDTSFSLHEDDGSTFQFTQQEGEVTFEVEIPTDD